MTSTRRLLLILFLSSAAFGQRSGGFGRSAGSIMGQTAPGPSVHIRALPGTTRGGRFASGFGPSGYRTGSHYGTGYGFYTSHIPLSGYGLYAPYSPPYGDDQF